MSYFDSQYKLDLDYLKKIGKRNKQQMANGGKIVNAISPFVSMGADALIPGSGAIVDPLMSLLGNNLSQGDALSSIADSKNQLNASINPYQMKKGGYLKDENTYVTKDGRETRRGLWANVYLKKKKGKRYGGIIDNKTGENGKSYNTKLTKEEEKNFRKWFSEVSKYKNLDPNPDADNHYYDYRGYWKNENRDNILQDNSDAHFIDKYKKPGHPTFSTDSIYSNKTEQGGVWSQDDKGTWYFKHSPYTEKYLQRTTEYLDGSGEYSITTKNDTIRNFDDFKKANNKLKIKQNIINDIRKEYKNGGMIDNSMVDGGKMVNVSDDAQMVKANNPQDTDSVETPQAFLDHNEMLIDMPNGGKFVFSDYLKDEDTGESFASIAKGLVDKRDSGEISEEEYNMYITELANDNEKQKTMKKKTMKMKNGGKMMYVEGGMMDPMQGGEAMMEGESMMQENMENQMESPDVMGDMGVEGDMGASMEGMTDEGFPVNMPDGQQYMFSPDLKEQSTGQSFAAIAQQLTDMFKQGQMQQEQYMQAMQQLAQQQEQMKGSMSEEQKAGMKCGGYMKSKKMGGGYMPYDKFNKMMKK